MRRDCDEIAALVHNADIGKRLPLLRVDLRNVVGERDRIADEHCSEESNLVVAERNRRFAENPITSIVKTQAGRSHQKIRQKLVRGSSASTTKAAETATV
jgi:hypothetical protein